MAAYSSSGDERGTNILRLYIIEFTIEIMSFNTINILRSNIICDSLTVKGYSIRAECFYDPYNINYLYPVLKVRSLFKLN